MADLPTTVLRRNEIVERILATLPPVRNAGDSYDNSHRLADGLREALKTETDPGVQRLLRRSIDQADYVGD